MIEIFNSAAVLLDSQRVTTDIATVVQFTGVDIAQIVITNPGPASPPNPPYITAIDGFTANVNVAGVPEPASVALLGIGLVGLGFVRKRRSVLAVTRP